VTVFHAWLTHRARWSRAMVCSAAFNSGLAASAEPQADANLDQARISMIGQWIGQ
jgi:hypothetical protein